MRGGVDLLELLDREMRVELRRLELGVIEQGLDHPRVGSVLEHVRRAGVPEEVATARLADVGRVHVVADHLREPVRREGLAQVRQKQGVVALGATEIRAGLLKVLGSPGERSLADGDHPVLPSLAEPHEDKTPVGVQIVELQAAKLHAADSRRVERFHHRAIPKPHRGQDVRLAEHKLGLAGVEDVARKTLLKLRKIEVGGGIRGKQIALAEPFEEGSKRKQSRVLRAEAQLLPALRIAIVVEPTLVAFEDLLGDLGRLREASLLGPEDEAVEVALSVPDCNGGVITDRQPFEVQVAKMGEPERIARVAHFLFRQLVPLRGMA